MARFWRSSLSRFFCYTASDSSSPSSSFLATTFHRRHISSVNEHRRNIWILGLVCPSKNKKKIDKMSWIGPFERNIQYMMSRLLCRAMPEISRDRIVDSVSEMARIIKGKRPTINYFRWNYHEFTMFHTPGPASYFTLDEVDNALCHGVDGAVLVLCSVGGVKRKSIMLDKQMIRYEHPRLVFINNLELKGANPWEVLNQARSKLRHYSAAVQVPIGLENDFKGLVDLVQLKAYYLHGSFGDKVFIEEVEIPENMEALVSEKRRELIENVSKVDDKLAEAFCSDKLISGADLKEAVRRATIARKFIPVYMGGNAFNYNKGLLLLFDGVIDYFPSTIEASDNALDQFKNGEKHTHAASTFAMEDNSVGYAYGRFPFL